MPTAPRCSSSPSTFICFADSITARTRSRARCCGFSAATVITNLFTAIPVFGNGITQWLWGGYAVDEPTLQRFFALHYLLPFMIVGVVVLHIWALHHVGQGNPVGIDVKS